MLGADAWGAPHGQFDAPYGLINPNSHFAMVAQRYLYEYDLEPRTLAKIAVQGGENALLNPKANLSGPADHDRRRAELADGVSIRCTCWRS